MSVTISSVYQFRDRLLEAIERLKEAGVVAMDVMSPVPDHEILDAVPMKKTRVGFFTLFGGIFGLIFGFGGASWCHIVMGLITGGKPIVSVPPFVIVGFEMTILFGGLATLTGVILLCRLPRLKASEHYDGRAAEDHYVLVVETSDHQAETAREILRETGGEVRE